MLEEVGRVIKVEGGQALVEMKRQAACANCGICTLGIRDKMEVLVENSLGAKVNDQVMVTIAGPVILKSAFIVYILPLFGLLLGYLLGKFLGGEKVGVLAGIAGTLLIMTGLHFYDRKIRKENKLVIRISEILKEGIG